MMTVKVDDLKKMISTLRGCLASIDCGEDGMYQGKVQGMDDVEKQLILQRAMKDGIPLKEKTVKVSNRKIKEVKVYPKGDQSASPGSTRQVGHLRGFLVSVDYGSEGLYQGQVYGVNVDARELTLEKATCDGIPLGPQRHVTLSATKIQDLKVYRTTTMLTPPSLLMPKQVRQSQPVKNRNDPGRTDSTPGRAFGDRSHFDGYGQGGREVRLAGPTGIPSLDTANGYKSTRPGGGELETPLDMNVLQQDFDFDVGFAEFDKQKVSDCDEDKDPKKTKEAAEKKKKKGDIGAAGKTSD